MTNQLVDSFREVYNTGNILDLKPIAMQIFSDSDNFKLIQDAMILSSKGVISKELEILISEKVEESLVGNSAAGNVTLQATRNIGMVMLSKLYEQFINGTSRLRGHDFDHSLRVLSMALQINAEGNIDRDILTYSALMHDLSCLYGTKNHYENSALWAEQILRAFSYILNVKVQEEAIKKIATCIREHGKPKGDSDKERKKYIGENIPELLLIHDADALDITPQRIYESRLSSYEKVRREKSFDRHPNSVLFNVEETMEHRVEVITNGLDYRESDGLTDLYAKCYYRFKMGIIFLHNNTKLIAEKKSQRALQDIVDFLEQNRATIYKDFGMDRKSYDNMLSTLDRLHEAVSSHTA